MMYTVVSNPKSISAAWDQLFTKLSLNNTELRRLLLVKDAMEKGEFVFSGELSRLNKEQAIKLYDALMNERRPQLIEQLVASNTENCHLITEMAQFEQLLTWLADESSIVLDSHRIGENIFHAETMLSGLSLTLPTANQHAYIPLRYGTATTKLTASVVFHHLKPYFENEQLKKVMFEAKPTLHLLRKNHIHLKGLIMDVQVAAHLLNENEIDRVSKGDAYSLKSLVETYGKFFNVKQPLAWESDLFKKQSLHQMDETLATAFSCQRTRLIQAYYEFVCRQFDRLPRLKELHDTIENPLIEVCVDMEQTGLLVDVAFAEAYENKLTNEIASLEEELKTLLGDINFKSDDQLKKVFYKTLGFRDPEDVNSEKVDKDTLRRLQHPSVKFLIQYRELSQSISTAETQKELATVTTELNKLFGNINFKNEIALQQFFYDHLKLRNPENESSRNVDSETLLKLKHPSIELLLRYKKLSKLLSTYVTSLLKKITPQHRLHGNFNQCGAETGRFSSNNPNLQNFPKEARQLIIPATGKIIVGIDYSQIEPRFLSHLTQDPSFMKAYIEGRDLYSEIASKTFNLPISECGDQSKWRKMIKTGMLATMYGTSAYSLGKDLGITMEEAQQFIDDFYNSYPVMKAWTKEVTNFADKYGYVETVWGRKRRFEGHKELAEKRNALHQEISQQLKKESFRIWDEKRIPYAKRKAYQELEKPYSDIRRKTVNSIIQGSAADLLKLAMIDLHQFLTSKGPEWRLLATIHDEMLFEIPASATREEIEALAAVQRDAVRLSVPMKVDVEIYQRWSCKMSLDEWFEHKESPLSLSQLL